LRARWPDRAPGGAAAAHQAAVAIERSDADQGRDLLAPEAAKFGQFGQEGMSRCVADAGHALQEVIVLPPDRRATDRGVEVALDLAQLLLQDTDVTLDAPQHRLLRHLPPPVGLGADHLHHLAAPRHQLAERLRLFVGNRARFGTDRFGKVSDRRRIERVGPPGPASPARGQAWPICRWRGRSRGSGGD